VRQFGYVYGTVTGPNGRTRRHAEFCRWCPSLSKRIAIAYNHLRVVAPVAVLEKASCREERAKVTKIL